jgi:hypothetical protein
MLIVPTAMEGEGGFGLQLPYPASFIVALPGDEIHRRNGGSGTDHSARGRGRGLRGRPIEQMIEISLKP